MYVFYMYEGVLLFANNLCQNYFHTKISSGKYTQKLWMITSNKQKIVSTNENYKLGFIF